MVTVLGNPEVQPIGSHKTVVLMGVSGQTFMALLTEVGEDQTTRFAEDRGVL